MGLAVAATSGLFVAGKHRMQTQAREVETTQAARAAIDLIVRELRLGGACLPVTGGFISLAGADDGNEDEITTRTGLTRPDLSCVRSAVPIGATVTASGTRVPLLTSDGFAAGMRAYIRHPDGGGEFFDVTAVPSSTELTKGSDLSRDYPQTSGVYAIDERRFYLEWQAGPHGNVPQLMLQVGSASPSPLAVGIEELSLRYQLQRHCPPCDVVDLPADNAEWSLVEQLLLSVTARSALPDTQGHHYRRTLTVAVKPRNLLAQ